ncbi:hypothetical protein UlMin_016742 [Ulmus minor]
MSSSASSMAGEKQGIGTILGCDDRTRATSLRRTLSADMSSKKWLAQHGFYPIKKIASSNGLCVALKSSSLSSSEEEDYEDEEEEYRGPGDRFDVWSSIQEQKIKDKVGSEKPTGEFDIWSSIISQKQNQADDSKSPPYVHPLVKRSSSSLTQKSLQVCTESLGSETGSDEFSSSETEKGEEEEEQTQQEEEVEEEKRHVVETFEVVKYNYSAARKSPPRSFPPPLPSLSRDGNGAAASLRMQTHRDNGRLVVEAVSVPSQRNFTAQRQDGRLVLTFLNTSIEDQNDDEFDVQFENFEDEEEDEEIEIDEDEEDEPKVISTRVINVHRLALMMNKPIGFAYRNASPWPNKFNKDEESDEVQLVKAAPIAQSLPPRPPVTRMIPAPPATGTPVAAAAASFNAYEYYWRASKQPTPATKATTLKNDIVENKQTRTNDNNQAALRGEYLVKGCKEPRRSLLFLEPFCIATS